MQRSEREARSARSALTLWGALLVLLPSAVLAACMAPSPAALLAPGPVEPVESLIRIEGTLYEPEGHLYLTAVRATREPCLGQYLLARLQPSVVAVPKSEVAPSFMGHEEFLRLSQRLLEESQSIAQIIALREAGYDVKIGAPEVQVVAIAADAPAAAQLQEGDVIEAANGEEIETTAELVSIVQSRVTGEPVSLRIRRGKQQTMVSLPATRGPLDTEGPVLGIVTVTTGLSYHAPVNIKIEPAQVAGGPSTGLIYALGVYNALVTEDITRGHRIAGTGTVRLNGTVGPVGGIALKVQAAEEAGAEYFLAPAEDAAAARSAARDIKVIAIRSFKEALIALRELDMDPSHRPYVVPTEGETILAAIPNPMG